jgi:hypothetical protein
MLLGDWESIEAQYRTLGNPFAQAMLQVQPLLRNAPELATAIPGISIFTHHLYLTVPGMTDRIYIVLTGGEHYEIVLIRQMIYIARRQQVVLGNVCWVVENYLEFLIE